MFWEGLTMLGFDDNSSNSAQESSPNEESNDSSDDFSANKPSASKKKKAKKLCLLQLPCGRIRPAHRHSCGKARQKRVKLETELLGYS